MNNWGWGRGGAALMPLDDIYRSWGSGAGRHSGLGLKRLINLTMGNRKSLRRYLTRSNIYSARPSGLGK